MSIHSSKILSAGECPVCYGSGALIVLYDRLSAKPVFFCPSCGTAWLDPPLDMRVDEIASLRDRAPGGVRMPRLDEVDTLTQAGLHLEDVTGDEWEKYLTDLLASN